MTLIIFMSVVYTEHALVHYTWLPSGHVLMLKLPRDRSVIVYTMKFHRHEYDYEGHNLASTAVAVYILGERKTLMAVMRKGTGKVIPRNQNFLLQCLQHGGGYDL